MNAALALSRASDDSMLQNNGSNPYDFVNFQNKKLWTFGLSE
jgi:hypothetical protein